MKRKYNCSKVKRGDWVYFYDNNLRYDSICKYKVLAVVNEGKIIVEVKNNKKDSKFIRGWLTDSKMNAKDQYCLPSGIRAWYVDLWKKVDGKCLDIE